MTEHRWHAEAPFKEWPLCPRIISTPLEIAWRGLGPLGRDRTGEPGLRRGRREALDAGRCTGQDGGGGRYTMGDSVAACCKSNNVGALSVP